MTIIKKILADLEAMANPAYTKQMAYFGIDAGQALGIKNGDLKPYAKTWKKDQELAAELWKQPIHEAKHLAILLMEPERISVTDAENWVRSLYSWDLCDGLCMKIFPKTEFAYDKALEWTTREPEFEKRAGFASMVGITLNRKVPDQTIEKFFPIMEREAWDERNFVKKAVNWSLRQSGKRNSYLNEKAITCAKKIHMQNSKAANWIASDALRELRSEMIQERLAKKDKKRAD